MLSQFEYGLFPTRSLAMGLETGCQIEQALFQEHTEEQHHSAAVRGAFAAAAPGHAFLPTFHF